MQILTAAKTSLNLNRVSMIPGIVVLFMGHLYSIHASFGKNLKWKQCSFYTFFFTESESKYQ